ncbi:MAG: hypothetical protein SA339_04075 [Methanomassiliicoccus sp.]|nr:hypothetical protein [Methanomassiliicoccus sp.]
MKRVVNDPKASKTIATKFPDGKIHTIYMGSLISSSPDELVFAHILMKRTQQNLENMKREDELVSVLVTLESASYEIMVKVGDYLTSGPKVDDMVEVLKAQGIMERMERFGMKLLGIWILIPEEIWDQRPGPHAGTRIV